MFSTSVPMGTTFLHAAVVSGEITREYDDLMADFNDAFIAKNEQTMDQIENIIFLRRVAEVWNLTLTMSYNELSEKLLERVEWVKDEYLAKHQPGDGIPRDLQLLKGCMREAEVSSFVFFARTQYFILFTSILIHNCSLRCYFVV